MKTKIMEKKGIGIILLVMFLVIFQSAGLVLAQDSEDNNLENSVVIDFFWSQGCPHCAQLEDFLAEMEEDYDFELNSYDMSKNSELFSEKAEEYDIPNNRRGYTPTIFIDDKYFIGNKPEARNYIESRLEGSDENKTGTSGENVSSKIFGLWEVNVSLDKDSAFLAGVVLALLDSINVCSITILVFLIVFSLSIGSPKKAFKIGLVFTFIIFLFYVMFMLVLTEILGALMLDYGIYIRSLVVLICFAAGLLLIKDFFWYGKGISLKVPEASKPLMEKYIKKATIGSTIILGVLASLVELPCTAVFPLAYTTFLAEVGIEGIQKIVYVLVYNLIYIWPLIFIVFATYFSWLKIEDIEARVEKSKKWMKLIAGIALLVIGLYFGLPLLN